MQHPWTTCRRPLGLPTCQTLESFSRMPLTMLHSTAARAAVLGSKCLAVGYMLPALIAFWHERHFKSERASCACLCVAGCGMPWCRRVM
jgi:hypothetical protein